MMAQLSGQITVATAGTAVSGPLTGPGWFLLQPNPGNSGAEVYVGNDGANDVASTTGFTMQTGEKCYVYAANLNQVYFDVATNGDKVDWLKSEDPII